jgi:hypothetical protein
VRIGVLVLVLPACLLPSAVAASPSPTTLLTSILAAGRAQHSVHVVSVATFGLIRVKLVGDAGVSSGIQRITFSKGSTTGQVTVIVSSNTAYVRGDAFTLVNYMGFKRTPAVNYAGKWVLIPHTDGDFSTVAAAVRIVSAINELELTGSLSRVAERTIAGQRVFGVKGRLPSAAGGAVATVYARLVGRPLPVEAVASQGTGRSTSVLGRWNEPLSLVTPVGAVPIATTGLE